MVVVRENTEGEYAQVGGFVHQHTEEEVAVQSAVFTGTASSASCVTHLSWR